MKAEVLETLATGINVEGLHAVAQYVEALVDADDLLVLAEKTRDEAYARERAAFDAKWGDFWKEREKYNNAKPGAGEQVRGNLLEDGHSHVSIGR